MARSEKEKKEVNVINFREIFLKEELDSLFKMLNLANSYDISNMTPELHRQLCEIIDGILFRIELTKKFIAELKVSS